MMFMLITMISMVVFATMIIRITMHWITITMIVTNNDNNDNNDDYKDIAESKQLQPSSCKGFIK